MTFKVMIAEDESEKAKGIAYLVEKYNPECTPVLIAADGVEGYEMALRENPDIILTDIRMPNMDGLEMIRALRDREFPAEFVVLSGYAEFNYAKKAIELGVRNFITKPVDEMELSGTLQQVCREIAEKRSTEDSRLKMNDDMRNYVLRDFLEKGEGDIYKVKESLEQIGAAGTYREYACLVAECENPDSRKEEMECPDFGEEEEIFLYCVKSDPERLIFLAAGDSLDAEKKKMIGEKCLCLMDENNISTSIGIGGTYGDCMQLPKSYEEACIALNYRILKMKSREILYEQLCDLESNQEELITDQEMERLRERIDRFDQEGFRVALKSIFNRILSENQLTLPDLQKLSLNIVLMGLHNIPLAQIQMNEYFGKNLFTLKSIEKFRTIEQLENWIINMINSMNELMVKDSIPKKKDVIAEAKEYIRQHYDQNVSLNDISRQFYINPSYFSQLFKKKTGMTYQNYLTEYRIDRAAKLLEETDLRIYEVCQMVGYSDVNHFNQLFERLRGMKPNEYRKKCRNE